MNGGVHHDGRLRSAASTLRIGIIAPPWVPVPPVEYGGTELVVDLLARALQAAGHEVILFTTGDATCPIADRRWVHERAVGTMGTFNDELAHVQAAYEDMANCDVIHDHTLAGPLWAAARPGRPGLATTIHGELEPMLADLYRRVSERAAVIAISHHQRRTAPDVPVAAVIHHGIDVDRIRPGAGDGGYVLFLGRMHPAKGVHRAIDVTRATGRRLVIAAKMWEPEEYRYFDEMIRPRLGPDVEYLGPVGGQAKLDLLAGAESLINPIRWNEPFGLVMAEALAAGTPVLAFPEGAAPEIIDHGVTGYLCRDEADMAARLDTVTGLDRAACRQAAEDRFGADRMAAEHLSLYRHLADGTPGWVVNTVEPVAALVAD